MGLENAPLIQVCGNNLFVKWQHSEKGHV